MRALAGGRAIILATLTACSSGASGPTASGSSAPAEADPPPAAPPAERVSVCPEGPETGASMLRVCGRPVPGEGTVELSVLNQSGGPMQVRRAARLERLVDREFAPVSAGAIWVRSDCDPRDGVIFWSGGADECVTLASDEAMRIAPWLGTVGDAQCACDRCAPAPAGRYRLVVTTCDGHDYPGEPFDFTPEA